jgi:hypothetical protein
MLQFNSIGNNAMAQYITIQNFWESPKFHCPVCGAEVFTENGEPTDKPCEHVLFSWIDQVGDFLSRCPDTAVLFAMESSGMACGPVSLTVIHAIKFPEAN